VPFTVTTTAEAGEESTDSDARAPTHRRVGRRKAGGMIDMRSKGVNELIVACERERIQTGPLDESDDLIK